MHTKVKCLRIIKIVILKLFLLNCITANAQQIDAKKLRQQIDQSKAQLQQMQKSIDSGIASKNKYYDSINNARNLQNLESFTKQYNEKQKANKRKAFIRLGIGILFGVVLVIGLMRKRKK